MKKQSNLSRLFEYAGNFKYLTILSWILSCISAIIALLPYIYIWRIIKEVLDVAPNFTEGNNLAHYGWMAVGFSVLSMLIYVGALMCSHIGAFRIASNIRSRAMHHIVTLPMGFMDDFGSGKLRKIVNESSGATETYLAHQLPDRAGAIATPIGMIVLLFVFDWRLGFLSLIPVALAFLIMMTMTGVRMKRKMKEYQDSLERMSNEAVEYVRGIPVVKTFGQSVYSFKRFKNSIDSYSKWVIAYTKDLRIPMLFYTTVINAVFVVLIAAALIMTQDGVTNAFLINLLFYIIFTPIISVTLTKIMFSSENTMIVQDALSRIDSIMTLESMKETKKPVLPMNNSIDLLNASFRYKKAQTDALHNVSIHIEAGKKIAFIGPSGSGKTTLASIIARFWDVINGEVKIGGINVKDISKEDLMNTVSFVFQDSKLLKTSVFENVRMAKPNATREEVNAVLEAAQCGDIISKLPNGMDTIIGTKGVYLSGGEQQRIAIARVMLKNAPILILDEATAFADPDNEHKVQAAFNELSKEKTVLMIAHRLSTVVDADEIFVLKDGSICENGSHEELLQQKGIYASMWREYQNSVKWKVKKGVCKYA
ncbi:ABC transporter ATP-binding protein [Anaerovorax sp. IOR16]|uniref:ABC transporter ATP-binding protein n=1 Tax=Anaerovorax sp. IOR16 TaxID=2773458 RepID=UPI0019CFB4F6|nr:ABC transporter ATP-binding protein [Anaerovorax sp. IOR16]